MALASADDLQTRSASWFCLLTTSSRLVSEMASSLLVLLIGLVLYVVVVVQHETQWTDCPQVTLSRKAAPPPRPWPAEAETRLAARARRH